MRIELPESLASALPSRGGSEPVRVGVDIVEIDRVHAAVERWGERFLRRVYTAEELAYCRGRPPQLAARFAAKEAVMKALGTGIRGVGWKEVEVCKEASGAPAVRLHGRARTRARSLGIGLFSISLSPSRKYAVAFVIAVRGEPL